MQPVHSRNVNAHTCLGGKTEASLVIGSAEQDREGDGGSGRMDRNPLGCETSNKYQEDITKAQVSHWRDVFSIHTSDHSVRRPFQLYTLSSVLSITSDPDSELHASPPAGSGRRVEELLRRSKQRGMLLDFLSTHQKRLLHRVCQSSVRLSWINVPLFTGVCNFSLQGNICTP